MDYRGYQVFIIHPDESFREQTVEFLRKEEYEAFGFGSTDPVALDNRRESVVFLYLNGNQGWDCKSLVTVLTGDGHDVHLVALGRKPTEDCFSSFLTGPMDKLGTEILEYLNRTGARGHRHYVRFGSQNASIATFDFHEGEKRFAGIIHDISVRGISCTFRPEPEGSGPRKVSEMHLNLPGFRCHVKGRMTTRRVVSGQIIHVFMFEHNLSPETMDRIHDFIYVSLSMKLSVH